MTPEELEAEADRLEDRAQATLAIVLAILERQMMQALNLRAQAQRERARILAEEPSA